MIFIMLLVFTVLIVTVLLQEVNLSMLLFITFTFFIKHEEQYLELTSSFKKNINSVCYLSNQSTIFLLDKPGTLSRD